MKREKQTEFEFWKKYIEADSLERQKIIDKLWERVIKKSVESYNRLPKKYRDKIMSQLLNSYFDDLVNTLSCR